jgi:DNA mismatch endonuclease (patch repair protein)
MLGNRARDTKPELAVRRLLHARGLRYRVDFRPSPQSRGRADIVFTRRKIAVFIDGCFWHGCPLHATHPKTNVDYWAPKLARNIERDVESTVRLRELGWTVLRFWEHEPPAAVAAAIEATVLHNGSPGT